MFKAQVSRARRSGHRVPFLLLFALLGSLITACLTGTAAAETRIALVIGIDAYQNAPPLANPVEDARAIGDALRRLNFDVEELHDPDFRALSRGLRNFGIRAQTADTAVVYYAGHGVQFDRENYLIPADARLERAHDLEYEALPLSLMLEEVSQASRIGIVLLDSCRNNPFSERVSRGLTIAGRAVDAPVGLARVDNVPRNTMVVMAAKAGQVAEDGQGHSPFAAAILAHLQVPGLELSLFFRSVRDTVLRATQNRQEPYVFSSLGAEPFYFYPRPPNRPPEIAQIPTLEVLDTAGPTPLGIPRPTDPDQDPLTVRIVGLPRNGEVRVEGRVATAGEAFGLDHFMTGTFKPDGSVTGPIGTLDILVEDGRGGTALGSLRIIVQPSKRPQIAEAPATRQAIPETVAPTPPPPAALPPQPTAPPPQPKPASPQAAATSSQPAAPSPQPPPAPPQAMATPPQPAPPSPPASPQAAATSSQPATSPPQPAQAPPAFSLADAQALALTLPCALIDIRAEQAQNAGVSWYVTGPALQGAAFDAFLKQLGGSARLAGVSTERLDPGLCTALAVFTDLLRRNRDHRDLRLTAPAFPVPSGGQLVINAQTAPDGALYIDLYAGDGTVQHLHRGPVHATTATDVPVLAQASGPPGQRLVVAIATPAPLDLDQRPARESETAYLSVLQRELAHIAPGNAGLRADLATLTIAPPVRPAVTPQVSLPAAAAPVRVQSPPDARCQTIVEHIQLGEPLSDADRAIFRTHCGR